MSKRSSRTSAPKSSDGSLYSSRESSASSRSSSTKTDRNSSRDRMSKSTLSNLKLPVPRIKAMLKVSNYAGRVSDTSAVFLTGVLEYMAAEILELSRNASRTSGARRIQSKHVNVAIKTDSEFRKFFRDATVVQSDVVPYHEQTTAAAGQRPMQPVAGPSRPSTPASKSSGRSIKSSKSSGKSRRSG